VGKSNQSDNLYGVDNVYGVNELLVGNNASKTGMRSKAFFNMEPDQFDLMDAMRGEGIVGNKYLTRLSAEDPARPQEWNFVGQDPSRIHLKDVYAATPIGLALGAAEQQRRSTSPKKKER
jgi:hypothetical protein